MSKIETIVRTLLEEAQEELQPLREALSGDALDDYVETVESVEQKIKNILSVMDNSELAGKLNSIA